MAKEEIIDYSNLEIAKAIDTWVHSQRDRDLLKRRLIDGIIYEKLADEFNLSVRQVKNIIYKEQEKVFRKLQ